MAVVVIRLPESEQTAGIFLIDQASELALRRVRRDYVDAMAVDAEDDEPDEEGAEDEA